MNIVYCWLIVGVIIAARKRMQCGQPMLLSTLMGYVVMWPFIYFLKLLDARL